MKRWQIADIGHIYNGYVIAIKLLGIKSYCIEIYKAKIVRNTLGNYNIIHWFWADAIRKIYKDIKNLNNNKVDCLIGHSFNKYLLSL